MPGKHIHSDNYMPTTCTVEEQANAIRKFMEDIRAFKSTGTDSFGNDFTDAQIEACNEFDMGVSILESAGRLLLHVLTKK